MSINWVKVEEKPEKKQSIEGKVLLDLRAKINDLELQLTKRTTELNNTKERLTTTQQNLDETSEKLTQSEKKLKESEKKISEKEENLKSASDKITDLQKKIERADGFAQVFPDLLEVPRAAAFLKNSLFSYSPNVTPPRSATQSIRSMAGPPYA